MSSQGHIYKVNEDTLQVYAADVLRAFKRGGVLAWHTPNGGHRHIAVAKKLKRMGTLSGVPDWTILVPTISTITRFSLYFLELKDAKGKQSPSQIEFQKAVEALGIEYRIARDPVSIDTALIEWGAIYKPISPKARASGA